MLTAILSKLAGFSLRNPKTIVSAVAAVAVGVFFVHYRLLVNERDKLEAQRAAYENVVADFQSREATLQLALRTERAATAVLAAERGEARRAIEKLREGRQSDPEAMQWAAQPVPAGELARLCVALPEMAGCSE